MLDKPTTGKYPFDTFFQLIHGRNKCFQEMLTFFLQQTIFCTITKVYYNSHIFH